MKLNLSAASPRLWFQPQVKSWGRLQHGRLLPELCRFVSAGENDSDASQFSSIRGGESNAMDGGRRLEGGSQPCCKERAGTKKHQGKKKKRTKEIRGRVQSREGNLVALVTRASSSQAHFVLFSTVDSGKSYLWKWKKGPQPAESRHSSARRGPTAERGSGGSSPPRARHFCKKSKRGGGKNHASEKAPCSPKTTCQPALNQSS